MKKIRWKFEITNEERKFLYQKLLGLTFFERRLREAQKLGVEKVYVLLPSNWDKSELPKVNKKLTAPYEIIRSEKEIPEDERSYCHKVSHLTLITHHVPYRIRFRIKTQEDFQEAKRIFYKDVVREAKTGWVGRKLNKPISLWISSRLANTSLTPNQWSYFNLLVGIASAYFIAQPSYFSVFLGGLLFQAASVFDGVDGEIAKFRLEWSRFGAWLDTFVDNFTLLVFLFGCGLHIAYFSHYGYSELITLVGFAAAGTMSFLGILIFFVLFRLRAGSLVAYEKAFLNKLPLDDPVVRLANKAKHLIKKNFFSFLFFVLCTLNLIDYVLMIAAFGPFIGLTFVLYLNFKYWSQAQDVSA